MQAYRPYAIRMIKVECFTFNCKQLQPQEATNYNRNRIDRVDHDYSAVQNETYIGYTALYHTELI